MFSANGCQVTLTDGTVLRRKRVVLGSDNVFKVYNRRTNELEFEVEVESWERQGRNRWLIETDEGAIRVAKSGCNCGN